MEAADPQNWVWIGRPDDVQTSGGLVVRTGQGPIVVFKTTGKEFYALLDRCPHRGARLSDGIVHGRRVVCPLHGTCVALESGEAHFEAPVYVPRYPVRVEGDRLYLGLAALRRSER